MNRRALAPAAVLAALLTAVVAAPSAQAKPPSPAPKPSVSPPPKVEPPPPPHASIIAAAKHLALQEKIKLVLPTGPAAPSDVEAPFTVSPRAPVVDGKAALMFFTPSMVRPDLDTAYLKGSHEDRNSYLGMKLHARANYRYLVDCIAISGSPVDMWAMTRGSIAFVAQGTSVVSVGNYHATLVIPKSTTDRDLSLQISSATYWSGGSCEVTPIR